MTGSTNTSRVPRDFNARDFYEACCPDFKDSGPSAEESFGCLSIRVVSVTRPPLFTCGRRSTASRRR